LHPSLSVKLWVKPVAPPAVNWRRMAGDLFGALTGVRCTQLMKSPKIVTMKDRARRPHHVPVKINVALILPEQIPAT